MRLFMYLGEQNKIGEDTFLVNTKIETSGGNPTDVGLFLNDAGSISYPLSKKSSDLNKNHVKIFKSAAYHKWVIVDYTLSYDPDLTKYDNIFIKTTVFAADTTMMNIKGSLEFSMRGILTQPSGGGIIGALINNVLGFSGDVKQRMENVTRFKDNIKDIGHEFYTEGEEINNTLEEFGESLVDFSSLINGVSNVVGFGTGLIGAISSFTNIFGGGSTQTEYTTGEGTIQMDGTLVNDFIVAKYSFGLPLVGYGVPADSALYQKPIGLFALKKTPTMHITAQRYTYKCNYNSTKYPSYALYLDVPYNNQTALKDLFRVNHNSHMKLVHVEAIPVVRMSGAYFSFPYSAYYTPVYKTLVQSTEYASGSRRIMYNTSLRGPAGTFKISTKFTIPNSMYFPHGYLIAGIPAEYFPNQVNVKSGYSCMEGSNFHPVRPTIKEAFVKFYLKFKNQQNGSIHAEIMRTYRADITQETIYK